MDVLDVILFPTEALKVDSKPTSGNLSVKNVRGGFVFLHLRPLVQPTWSTTVPYVLADQRQHEGREWGKRLLNRA